MKAHYFMWFSQALTKQTSQRKKGCILHFPHKVRSEASAWKSSCVSILQASWLQTNLRPILCCSQFVHDNKKSYF